MTSAKLLLLSLEELQRDLLREPVDIQFVRIRIAALIEIALQAVQESKTIVNIKQ